MRRKNMDAAYAALNRQHQVADWGADDVYQFLLGEGLTEAEAAELTRNCRPDEEFEM